jgi:hypothetical protein
MPSAVKEARQAESERTELRDEADQLREDRFRCALLDLKGGRKSVAVHMRSFVGVAELEAIGRSGLRLSAYSRELSRLPAASSCRKVLSGNDGGREIPRALLTTP